MNLIDNLFDYILSTLVGCVPDAPPPPPGGYFVYGAPHKLQGTPPRKHYPRSNRKRPLFHV